MTRRREDRHEDHCFVGTWPHTRPEEDERARGRGSQKRLGAFEGRRCARGLPKERQTGGCRRAGGIDSGIGGNGTLAASLLSPWTGPVRPDTRRAISNFERLFS